MQIACGLQVKNSIIPFGIEKEKEKEMTIIITNETRDNKTDDITLRAYEYEGNAMIEFAGAFRPFSLSENKILRVLKCAEELKQIFATNAKAQMQQEKTERAKNIEKESLDKQAREMTKKANVTDNPVETKTYKSGTFTNFVEWMQFAYDIDASQARQWITDAEYQAEYQAYLRDNEISLERPQKRIVSERPQKRVDAKKERATSGIPVSFSIVTDAQIVNGELLVTRKDFSAKSKKDVQRVIPVGTKMLAPVIHNGKLEKNPRIFSEADRDAEGSHVFTRLHKYLTLEN